jgi:hypothetical protein
MKSSFRYLIMLVIAAALGLTIFFVGKAEPEQKALFLGVDGDPRMRLCDSPINGELADAAVLKAMGIDTPFAKAAGDRAAYRVSVLRPANQESLSITFSTPQAEPGRYTMVRWDGQAITRASGSLDVTDAATLVYAFEDAKIWGELKRTIETLARAGQATAVIEVRAPQRERCISTRYDDERVRPLLAVFAKYLGFQPEVLPLGGLVSPQASFVPVAPSKAN